MTAIPILEHRLRRIVRGQVRSYFNDHPESFAHWKTERQRQNEIDGITKRIVGDVLVLRFFVGQDGGGVETTTARPVKAPASVLTHRALAGHLSFFAEWVRYLLGWHSIDSAPKTGEAILVTRYPATTRPALNMVRWCKARTNKTCWRVAGGEKRELWYEPTHWRSAPKPPRGILSFAAIPRQGPARPAGQNTLLSTFCAVPAKAKRVAPAPSMYPKQTEGRPGRELEPASFSGVGE